MLAQIKFDDKSFKKIFLPNDTITTARDIALKTHQHFSGTSANANDDLVRIKKCHLVGDNTAYRVRLALLNV